MLPPVYLTRKTGLPLQGDIEVSEPNLTRYDLYNADECFITGTAAEVVPVVKIDGRKIGTGRPGKHTKAFKQAYHDLTNASGAAIL